ncbi:stalk domain-containing protein [Paenibacillus agilis]|uniref:Copper amine oxidase-like N-terminal domain-containing protein n=1 Tax=Paenibacillus agilis TaxID=3020863 RepID=A0A559IP38_9BACL|nr:stalk domain-containing protein [Paenibacillus agilis]TVX89414.1 hypothetical protein FPZ44_16655 [Paenibacillus agilis]
MLMSRNVHVQCCKGSTAKMILLFVSILGWMVISTTDQVAAQAASQTDEKLFDSYKDVHFLHVSPGHNEASYNGKIIKMKNKPYIENEHFMLPAHWIAKFTGLELSVDGNRILLANDNQTWEFYSDSRHAILNGKDINLPVATKGSGEQMVMPIRVFKDTYKMEYFIHFYSDIPVYALVRYSDVSKQEKKILHDAHNLRRIGHPNYRWSIAYPTEWKRPNEFMNSDRTHTFEHRYDDLTLYIRLRKYQPTHKPYYNENRITNTFGNFDSIDGYSSKKGKGFEKPRIGTYAGNTFYEFGYYEGDNYSFLRTIYAGDTAFTIVLYSKDRNKVRDNISLVNTFALQYKLEGVETLNINHVVGSGDSELQ